MMLGTMPIPVILSTTVLSDRVFDRQFVRALLL